MTKDMLAPHISMAIDLYFRIEKDTGDIKQVSCDEYMQGYPDHVPYDVSKMKYSYAMTVTKKVRLHGYD